MRIATIVSVVCLGLSVLFLGLSAVWKPFCLFASVLFLVGLCVPAYRSFKNYYEFKKEIKEQRFVDAYLYADEHQTENIQNFKYDKKTERAIKNVNRNQFSTLFSFIALIILGIILFIVSINITFFQ